jgi:hypothetical protein
VTTDTPGHWPLPGLTSTNPRRVQSAVGRDGGASASAQAGRYGVLEPPVAAAAIPAGVALPRGGIMADKPGRLPLIESMLATPRRSVR